MTVKGLSSLFKKFNVPMLGRKKKTNNTIPAYMNQLSKRVLAVDTSMLIYKVNSIAIEKVCSTFHFEHRDGKWNRPSQEDVDEMFSITMKEYIRGLMRTGIRFIFIMEGKIPELKKETHEKRDRERTSRAQCEYDDLESHIKSMKDKYIRSQYHTDITISILKSTPSRILQAEYESEGVCSYLVREGKAHGALSEDGDLVMLGCPVMIRKLRALSLPTGHFEYEGLALVDVLTNIGFLQIERDDPRYKEEYEKACKRLQVLCISSGTDYHPGVFRMGILKIHSLMMENDCYTFDDVCRVDPRFSIVPYDQIIQTLEDNKKYTIIQ